MMSVCIDGRDMFELWRGPLPAYCSTVACMTPDGRDVRDARERSKNVVDALEALKASERPPQANTVLDPTTHKAGAEAEDVRRLTRRCSPPELEAATWPPTDCSAVHAGCPGRPSAR